MAVYLGNLKILSGTQGLFNNVVQTVGDSAQDVMSQKATTYNTSTQYGKCFQVAGSNQSFKLTDDSQVDRINNCDTISIRIVQRGTHPTQFENRYVAISGGTESVYGFYLKFYFASTLFYRQYKYGQAAYALNLLNGTVVCPDVYTVVIDRINGIVKYYAGNQLGTTYQADEFKSDYFIPSAQKSISLHSGDVQPRFFDVQIYDCDISNFYNNGTVINYNYDTAGAQMLLGMFHGGYQQPATYTDSNVSSYANQKTANWSSTSSGGTKTMTYTGDIVANNYISGGYYIGGTDLTHAYYYKSYITVTNGNIKISNIQSSNSSNSNHVLGVYDATTNEPVADINNIPPGSYYIYGNFHGPNCWWVIAVSGEPVVVHTKDSWKRVACLFHLKCDTLYNGKAYDDEVDTFYAMPAYTALSTTTLREPLIKTTNAQGQYVHYWGEIKVDKFNNANKIYTALDYLTWKQINNS